MKLPDFLLFTPLNNVRNSMRASLPESFSTIKVSHRLSLAELEIMSKSGKEIDLNEVIELDDGTLAYKDSRVLLYIRDVAIYHNNNFNNSLPKFHVSNCSALKKMRFLNRIARYVVATRTDGHFLLNIIKNNIPLSRTEKLNVCKCCLDALKYKGYSLKSHNTYQVFKDFSIDEYFELYPRNLSEHDTRNLFNSHTAPLNRYDKNFREKSSAYRAEKNWTCEKCKVDLSDMKYHKFLHTHHKDGQKYNNAHGNLESLCIYCHSQEPMSSHVKSLPDYKEFISIYYTMKKVA